MKLQRLLLALAFALVTAVPAAAQRYTAKQNGELIELADATAQMNVIVVPTMSNAWKIQVKGTEPRPHVRDARGSSRRSPGYNGMPLLAPFANRLDETAFYANGKKYNFDRRTRQRARSDSGTGFVNRRRRTGSSSSSSPTRAAPGSPASSTSTRTRPT